MDLDEQVYQYIDKLRSAGVNALADLLQGAMDTSSTGGEWTSIVRHELKKALNDKALPDDLVGGATSVVSGIQKAYSQ